MADVPIIHMSENSPEQVAFKLLREVASLEGKKAFGAPSGTAIDRKWLLDAYAECLVSVRNPGSRKT